MSDEIKNRSEIVFLYDVKDINPNGDPLDENKPRIDEETMINLVSDVRLKRTIRDYFYDFKKLEVFIRGVRKDDGTLKDKDERLDELKVTKPEELLDKCIDMRLFGATAAIKGKSITFTGPVQFRIGRSLHRVKLTFMKGTTVMPSEKKKVQGTFTEQYILPYSLIGFYGVVNENAGKYTHLTENDVSLLLEALWNGTKNLISRTKVGQMPRLLIRVIYTEKNYHIGDLTSMIRLDSTLADEEIRDVTDYSLEISDLVKILSINKGKIQSIEYMTDDRILFKEDGKDGSLEEILKKSGISSKKLAF